MGDRRDRRRRATTFAAVVALASAAVACSSGGGGGGGASEDGALPTIRQAECDDGGSCVEAYVVGDVTVIGNGTQVPVELVTSTDVAAPGAGVPQMREIRGVDRAVGVAMREAGAQQWSWGDVYDDESLTPEQHALERAWAMCHVVSTPPLDARCDDGGNASWPEGQGDALDGVQRFEPFADYVSEVDSAVAAEPEGSLAWRTDPIATVAHAVTEVDHDGVSSLDRCAGPPGYFNVCEVTARPEIRMFGADLAEVDVATVTAVPFNADDPLHWEAVTMTVELRRVGHTWWISAIGGGGGVVASGERDEGQREVRAAVADYTVDLLGD